MTSFMKRSVAVVVIAAAAAFLHHAAAQRRADAQADQSEKQQGDNSLHILSPLLSTLSGTTAGDAESSHRGAPAPHGVRSGCRSASALSSIVIAGRVPHDDGGLCNPRAESSEGHEHFPRTAPRDRAGSTAGIVARSIKSRMHAGDSYPFERLSSPTGLPYQWAPDTDRRRMSCSRHSPYLVTAPVNRCPAPPPSSSSRMMSTCRTWWCTTSAIKVTACSPPPTARPRSRS